MSNILAAIIGILAATVTSIVGNTIGPIAEWWFLERYKDKRETRKKKVREWRQMVRDVWGNARIMKELRREESSRDPDPERVKELDEQIDPRYQYLGAPVLTEIVRSDERFYSLRRHLSNEVLADFEEPGKDPGTIVQPDLLKRLVREIDRIESEWNLA